MSKSNASALLLHGAPVGYPLGHPVDGDEQIPWLRRVPDDRIPEALCAFNDRGRGAAPNVTGLHFFRNDEALLPVIGNPPSYVTRFAGYRILLTPDLTIGDGMPPWQRARAVSLARMVGVVWQERGLNVVPTLRWRSSQDYEIVASGIPLGSIVAVASYGSRRDYELRQEFDSGLAAMVERLAPNAVLVYGSTNEKIFHHLSKRTTFIEYLPPMASRRGVLRDETIRGQNSLFEIA